MAPRSLCPCCTGWSARFSHYGYQLQLQYDTFEILATAWDYIFGGADQRRYTIKIRTGSPPRRLAYLPLLLPLALRRRRNYRLIDHIVILKLPAIIYPLIKRWRRRLFPKYARKVGMGIETVLK